MNKRKLITALLLMVALFAVTSIIYASGSLYKVYLDNKKVPVKTIVKNGELYVSVKDLSRHFPEKMILDTGAKRLDFHSSASLSEKTAAIPEEPEKPKGIYGSLSLKNNDGKEFFIKGVKVTLYRYNPDMTDEISLAQLKNLALGEDKEYTGSHGKVREGVTNSSGNFYLAGAAPGKYEIVAIYYTNRGRSGILWRNIIEVKRNKPLKVEFNTDNAVRF